MGKKNKEQRRHLFSFFIKKKRRRRRRKRAALDGIFFFFFFYCLCYSFDPGHRALGAQGIEAEDEDRLIRILVVTIRVVFGCLDVDVMAKRKKFFPAFPYGIPQLGLFPLCSSLLFSLE